MYRVYNTALRKRGKMNCFKIAIGFIIVQAIIYNIVLFVAYRDNKTYKLELGNLQTKNQELRRNLLSCGEAVRQANELLMDHTVIIKLSPINEEN